MSRSIFPLIQPGEVNQKLTQPDVVIIDARGGSDAIERYKAGHVDGAVMVNLESELSQVPADAARGGRHPLPEPATFARMLGNKGITPAKHILVYDDKNGANAAARFWWMLKAAGHEKIQVVDGGLAALREAGVPMATGTPSASDPVDPYPISEGGFPVADIETVDRFRKNDFARVMDVREEYRYRGESEPIDLVAGHIPGAVNVPYLNNLDTDGRFRTASELARYFKSVIGDVEPDNIVVHCGSGVTACHTLLAMDVAGLALPRLYVGSWSEWSRNEKPIARGETP